MQFIPDFEKYLVTKTTAVDSWHYIIFPYANRLYCKEKIISHKFYETRDEAKQAVIDHIDRLEGGEK